MNVSTSCGLEGRYRLRIGIPGQQPRIDIDFPNLILNVGLNAIGTNLSGGYLRRAELGTGTATPAATDTGLQIPGVVSTTAGSTVTSSTGFVAGPPPYSWARYQFVFAQGVATGTWTEVGVGISTVMWSRALIVNGGGTPTPITVLAIEELTVEYELRVYPSIVDVTGTVNDGATNHSYTLRPARLSGSTNWPASVLVSGGWMSGGSLSGSWKYNGLSGAIGAYTGSPSGTSAVGDSGACSVNAYSSSSYRKTQIMTAAVAQGNVSGGTASIEFAFISGNSYPYQIEFSPVVAKDNTKTLSFTASINWARRP